MFEVDKEDAFNQWHRRTSLANKEPGQKVIVVKVQKWRMHSTIEEMALKAAS